MNADQLKGKWMQFKGELKQKYGKFTDDDLQQIEGAGSGGKQVSLNGCDSRMTSDDTLMDFA